jgi:hypothetical protein
MKIEFTQIRNQIRKFRRNDLLEYCFQYLDKKQYELFPIWNILIIMKWSYEHAEYNHSTKNLDYASFVKIYNLVHNFNDDHISNFLKEGKIEQGIQIFHSQQFYFQTQVYLEVFALQLKLYRSTEGKYNIEKSFLEKTGISIFQFLFITEFLWLTIQSGKSPDNPLKYFGHINDNILQILNEHFSAEIVENYFNLTVLQSENAMEKILQFKRSLKNPELQHFGISFFTLYPFCLFKSRIKVIHPSVFHYFANHFVYDFMKSNDEEFTTEFGNRFEKYVELTLKEAGVDFQNENEIKKQIKGLNNLVDFYIAEQNIFIECKAVEVQMYTLVNPTEDLLFSSLKDSILKAYYKQLLNVSKLTSPTKECWGIVLTYKEFAWSDFQKLHALFKNRFGEVDNNQMPPENVFIIDIKSWNLLIHIVKSGKSSLLDILQLARSNNSDPITRKQFFHMHLDIFKIKKINLSFLKEELDQFKI